MKSFRMTLSAATGIAALVTALPATAQDSTQDVRLPALPAPSAKGDGAIEIPGPERVYTASSVIEPLTQKEGKALPEQHQGLEVEEEIVTKVVDEDGVETVTRTRRLVGTPAQIHSSANTWYESSHGGERTRYVLANPRPAYAPAPVAYASTYPQAAYAPMVLNRESWIAECERRTRGRDKDDTGSIIGGLLGAIGGGILGNRLWDSERLAGTLIGGGVGGIAGALIGSLFNGDKEDDLYDCDSALSTYLDQYGQYGAPRIASRVIPAPAPVAYPAYGYSYAQAPAYYQPVQTMVMVPVTTYQQQRVVVREQVREETYEVPGAARVIPPAPPEPVRTPPPAPAPKLIKQSPAPSPKMIKH